MAKEKQEVTLGVRFKLVKESFSKLIKEAKKSTTPITEAFDPAVGSLENMEAIQKRLGNLDDIYFKNKRTAIGQINKLLNRGVQVQKEARIGFRDEQEALREIIGLRKHIVGQLAKLEDAGYSQAKTEELRNSLLQAGNRLLNEQQKIQTRLNKVSAGGPLGRDSLRKARRRDDPSAALLELSRVAQDLPFGLLGIANNLDGVVRQFGRLKREAGGTGKALLRIGVGAVTTAGGFALLLNAVTSFIIANGGVVETIKAVSDWLGLYDKKLDELNKKIRTAAADSIDWTDSIVDLKEDLETLTDQAEKYEQVVDAIGQALGIPIGREFIIDMLDQTQDGIAQQKKLFDELVKNSQTAYGKLIGEVLVAVRTQTVSETKLFKDARKRELAVYKDFYKDRIQIDKFNIGEQIRLFNLEYREKIRLLEKELKARTEVRDKLRELSPDVDTTQLDQTIERVTERLAQLKDNYDFYLKEATKATEDAIRASLRAVEDLIAQNDNRRIALIKDRRTREKIEVEQAADEQIVALQRQLEDEIRDRKYTEEDKLKIIEEVGMAELLIRGEQRKRVADLERGYRDEAIDRDKEIQLAQLDLEKDLALETESLDKKIAKERLDTRRKLVEATAELRHQENNQEVAEDKEAAQIMINIQKEVIENIKASSEGRIEALKAEQYRKDQKLVIQSTRELNAALLASDIASARAIGQRFERERQLIDIRTERALQDLKLAKDEKERQAKAIYTEEQFLAYMSNINATYLQERNNLIANANQDREDLERQARTAQINREQERALALLDLEKDLSTDVDSLDKRIAKERLDTRRTLVQARAKLRILENEREVADDTAHADAMISIQRRYIASIEKASEARIKALKREEYVKDQRLVIDMQREANQAYLEGEEISIRSTGTAIEQERLLIEVRRKRALQDLELWYEEGRRRADSIDDTEQWVAYMIALEETYIQSRDNINAAAGNDIVENHKATLNEIRQLTQDVFFSILGGLQTASRAGYERWKNDRERELASLGYSQEEATKIIQEEGKKRLEEQNRLARIEILASTLVTIANLASSIAKVVPFPFSLGVIAAVGAAQMAGAVAAMKAVGSDQPPADFGSGRGATSIGITAGAGLQNVYGPSAGLTRASTVVTPTGQIVQQGPTSEELADALESRPVVVEIADSTTAKIVQVGNKVVQERVR